MKGGGGRVSHRVVSKVARAVSFGARNLSHMENTQKKLALVTGANSGLGFEAAAQLAEAGWGKVILACRSEEKGRAAQEELVGRTGVDPFDVLVIDTSEVDSAQKAADVLVGRGRKVDFLLLNAGASGGVPQYNRDGVELTWASTLVGHHVLAMRLLGDGLLSEHARIVIAGSEGARGNLPGMKVHDVRKIANEHFDGDLEDSIVALSRISTPFEFNNMREYGTAKMVVAWWAAALSRRLPPGMAVNCVSPGSAPGSNFARNAPAPMKLMMTMMKIVGPLVKMGGSVREGAARYLAALEWSEEESGHFYATAHRKELVGPLSVQLWPEYFVDEELQEAGFRAVEIMTRVECPQLSRAA